MLVAWPDSWRRFGREAPELLNVKLMQEAPTDERIREVCWYINYKVDSKREIAKVRHWLGAWGEYAALARLDESLFFFHKYFMEQENMSPAQYLAHIDLFLPKTWRNA